MNKVLGLAFLVYFLGDPSLSMLKAMSTNAEYFVSFFIALITIPWVTAQFEN